MAATAVYDRRWVTIRDSPIRSKKVVLRIRNRRFSCPSCNAVFTEPVPGVRKFARTSERYRKSLLWACETFADLKTVRRHYRCSSGYLEDTLYAELERRQRTRQRHLVRVPLGRAHEVILQQCHPGEIHGVVP